MDYEKAVEELSDDADEVLRVGVSGGADPTGVELADWIRAGVDLRSTWRSCRPRWLELARVVAARSDVDPHSAQLAYRVLDIRDCKGGFRALRRAITMRARRLEIAHPCILDAAPRAAGA